MKKFFIVVCVSYFSLLFCSTHLEKLSIDYWSNVQKYVRYPDLINVSYVNSDFYKIFNFFIEQRLEKDIPRCFEKSPFLNFLMENNIKKGEDILFPKHPIFKQCLLNYYKTKNNNLFFGSPFYYQYVNDFCNHAKDCFEDHPRHDEN